MSTPLRKELLEQVYAHAREAFPLECCGYLTDQRVIRCTNVDASPSRFAIGGAELLAFARSFDGAEPARVLYHSHTNGRAYFSPTDREHAGEYPVEHLVIGVTAEAVREAARFDRALDESTRWGTGDVAAAVDAAIAGVADWEARWDAASRRAYEHARAGGLFDDLAPLRDRLAAVPISAAARALHDDWRRPRKLVIGAPEPPDTRVPVLQVAEDLDWLAGELAYEVARFRNRATCDCAILVRLKRLHARPSSPALRDVAGDGMYWNDWVCDACGQRWTEHKECDDVGISSSWEPVC